ncbi:MAG: chorismate mutase [Bacillota bacterium]
MRGIRGAITVPENSREEILEATELLLEKMIAENNVKHSQIVSIIFTATDDLDREYPAVAARSLGYYDVPLMCYQELNIRDSLSGCIRCMLYYNSELPLSEIEHVYLRKARQLRPDLV